jgi:hypothetical protein
MLGRGPGWRGILLAILSAAGAFIAPGIAAVLVAYAALGFGHNGSSPDGSRALAAVVLSSAILLLGAILAASAYYGILRLSGRSIPLATIAPIPLWQALLMLGVWGGSALLAQSLVGKGAWQWLAPMLYLVAIGTPVYILVRLTGGGVDGGSRRRFWGLLATGMLAGPALAVAAEIMAALLGLIVLASYLALHPAELTSLQQLPAWLGNATRMRENLALLAPLLDRPVVLLIALVCFSVATPLIEESTKSVAVWAVFDHLRTPAQGFLAGALSGAGFGLLESLLASATPDQNWGFALLVRGGSSMMHIAAASITGLGIARFRLARRPAPMLGAYALAVMLHGLWNGAVVTLAFGGMRMSFGLHASDLLATVLMALGATTLVVLCLTMPLALAMMNRRLRSTPAAPETVPALAERNGTAKIV